MTTAEKVTAMRDHLAAIDPDDLPEGAARDFAFNLQIIRGLGWDPFALVLPDDPNELDEMIDGAIGLLLNLRGDELPPFPWQTYAPDVPIAVGAGGISAAGIDSLCRELSAGSFKTPQDVITALRNLEEAAA